VKKILLATASLAAIVSIAAPALCKPAPAPATTAPAAAGQPQFAPFGVDLAGMDKTVQPGDDFYDYVNGTWNKVTEIPADKSSWGGFGILRDLSDKRTRIVIEDAAKTRNAPGSSGEKIGVAYAAFMMTVSGVFSAWARFPACRRASSACFSLCSSNPFSSSTSGATS